MSLHRREFLRRASYGLAAAPFAVVFSCSPLTERRGSSVIEADPNGILDVRAGLTVTVLDRKGDLMSDGFVSPARPDGMACFENDGGSWVLMRNHEIDRDHIGSDDGIGGYELDAVPSQAYSSADLGGVSRLVVDPATLAVSSSNLSLTGTRKNCAGGAAPMGWFTCEETIDDGGQHGFVFLCDPNADSLQPPQRIDAYGRFVHEAAGFDPATSICYLTEDRNESCLYRFLPESPDRPFDGQLQAMRVIDRPRFSTSDMAVGDTVSVDWIDVPDPLAGLDLPEQCQGLGAAVVARGEGCWFNDDRLVFVSTSGGKAGKGQIFEVSTSDELTVIAEATDEEAMSGPDNVVIAPDGSIYFAEDNGGDCLIQRISRAGTLEPIARSTEGGDEIAGLCFSPDGAVLFANVQGLGVTLAISGL